ncbi:MAG: UDP-3-O-(3-hydroxymyristoyl)glucosamine N-acyltransferase [Gammaproteobacteria bacterium]|nr:UDP-3-O-(3-hydroxymyristoyl)glucosamine N-acyltransferase [Gammaproteobacteria bacterium]
MAKELELEFNGEGELQISSVSTFTSAKKTDLCFLRSARFIKQLKQSQCGAVIVPVDFKETIAGKTLLYSANPDLSFINVINYLQLYKGNSATGIHPSAIIASTARLGKNVSIGANCVIGERVELGNNVKIAAACIIEDDVSIGANSNFLANVTVCFNVKIGNDVILQPGVVIGSDGFGLVYNKGIWVKIPHLGSVVIGDRVEIGANTTVDRGALDDTIIEQGVKLDNQIQVGHNVFIGENTAIAGCTGIAGSSIIGKNCRVGGAVSILGHLSIADNVTVTGTSTVTKDVSPSGTYSSGTPLMENKLWHRSNARYKSLDKLAKTVSNLKKNK